MMRKIVHVGTSDFPVLSAAGGALQRRMVELATVQVEDGHQVTILSPGDSDGFVEHNGVHIEYIRTLTPRPVRDYEFLARAALALRKREFDVLHAHGSPDAARLLGRHAVSAVHSIDYFRYRASTGARGHRYYTASLNKYDANLPVSMFCQREMTGYYPSLTTRVVVLPNGVNRAQFHRDEALAAQARTALGLPAGRLVIYLGRVCEQKGSDLLGDLARRVAATHPDVSVVAAGPPEQFGRAGLTPLLDELKSAGVLCPGTVDEALVSGLLSAADVFVLPTRRDEMFGMAALEAAACGAPVVASNLGGIPEAVGSSGLLFPVGDGAAMARYVESVLDDEALAAQLRRAADAHVERYSWREVASLAAVIYEEVLADAA